MDGRKYLDSGGDSDPVVNRPGVAGAVLQSPPSLIDSLSHGLWKYLQGTVNPKP